MKFSIRELIMVMLIVALALGWGIERVRRLRVEKERTNLMNELRDYKHHFGMPNN